MHNLSGLLVKSYHVFLVFLALGLTWQNQRVSAMTEGELEVSGARVEELRRLVESTPVIEWQGAAGVKLRGREFIGATMNKQTAILISPGFTEAHTEYAELVLDLLQESFGPIFVMDHRGQGLSDRLPGQSESRLATVDHGRYYVEDFANVSRQVVNSVRQSHPNFRLILVSHSMGSLIALSALTGESGSVMAPAFARHVMISPLLAVRLGSPFDSIGNSLSRAFLRGVSCFGTLFGSNDESSCQTLAPFARYDQRKQTEASLSSVTSSQPRLNIQNQWRTQAWSGRQMGETFIGPSARWVLEVTKLTDQLKNHLNRYTTPSLVMLAKHDVLVRNNVTVSLLGNNPSVRIEEYPGKHALYMEVDSVRQKVVRDMIDEISRP